MLVEGPALPAGRRAARARPQGARGQSFRSRGDGRDAALGDARARFAGGRRAWLEAFSAGLLALAERYGVDLVGGDTTRARDAPSHGHRDRRGAARAGARARRRAAGRRRLGVGRARRCGARPRAPEISEAAKRLHCPEPRVELGERLRRLGTRRSTSPTASRAILRTSSSARTWARPWSTRAFPEPGLRGAERPGAREGLRALRRRRLRARFTAPRAQRAELESLAARAGLALTRIGTIQAAIAAHGARRARQADRAPRRLRPLRRPMIALRPTPGFVFSHPAHALAFGFGAGLAPIAPGTFGTLLGWAIGWALARCIRRLCCSRAMVLSLSAYGPARSPGRHLGVADHGGMVWDEVVAFLLVLAIVPRELAWQAAAFGAVPLLRHRQAAADPPFRAALPRRLRRHVRRYPRRRLPCCCSPRCRELFF